MSDKPDARSLLSMRVLTLAIILAAAYRRSLPPSWTT